MYIRIIHIYIHTTAGVCLWTARLTGGRLAKTVAAVVDVVVLCAILAPTDVEVDGGLYRDPNRVPKSLAAFLLRWLYIPNNYLVTGSPQGPRRCARDLPPFPGAHL